MSANNPAKLRAADLEKQSNQILVPPVEWGNMSNILSSISFNLDPPLVQAALPLFAAEKVDAIEWSFDALYKTKDIPAWFVELLRAFSDQNRLIGHGIYFSLFSGKFTPDHQAWLTHLKRISSEFQFDHITEHFGFMTGTDYHSGAPMGVPLTSSTLAIGQDRIKRIADAAQCPVGIENLALAFSIEEVKKHGDFLAQLIEPVNGFIILDLHNLFCQMHNFGLTGEEILSFYPLEKVREIHISGGSWEDSITEPGKQIRRDTHDDAVPEAVFSLLISSIKRCPNLKYVVLEQMGTSLKTPTQQNTFQNDFNRMKSIVSTENAHRTHMTHTRFEPPFPLQLDTPLEDDELDAQQKVLSSLLTSAPSPASTKASLAASSLSNSNWDIEHWPPRILETAVNIARKWGDGF